MFTNLANKTGAPWNPWHKKSFRSLRAAETPSLPKLLRRSLVKPSKKSWGFNQETYGHLWGPIDIYI